jgi:hypothetical protein
MEGMVCIHNTTESTIVIIHELMQLQTTSHSLPQCATKSAPSLRFDILTASPTAVEIAATTPKTPC